MNVLEITTSGGHPQRQDNTSHVVSFWHIPGGCDYSNAEVHLAYFSNEQQAKVFENKYAAMPEMAACATIEYHDVIFARIKSKKAACN